MLSRYAAIVKNLRGVVAVDFDDSEALRALDWLSRRFRYRNLGLPPSLAAEYKERGGRLDGRPFLELAYPTRGIEELTRAISSCIGIDALMAEELVLASAYVSPIIAIGRSIEEELKSMAVRVVESRVSLDLKGWRLHLRIADYSVLDLYSWSTEHAKALWRRSLDSGLFVAERKEKIERDVRRYWRLSRGDAPPRSFLVYLDLASELAEKRELKELLAIDPDEASAGLAIEISILLTENLDAKLLFS